MYRHPVEVFLTRSCDDFARQDVYLSDIGFGLVKLKLLISFAPQVVQRLKKEAAKREIPVSELLRNIVDVWIDRQNRVRR